MWSWTIIQVFLHFETLLTSYIAIFRSIDMIFAAKHKEFLSFPSNLKKQPIFLVKSCKTCAGKRFCCYYQTFIIAQCEASRGHFWGSENHVTLTVRKPRFVMFVVSRR